MRNELKVGQRIDVYNCVRNDFNFQAISIGKTYVGIRYENYNCVRLLSKNPLVNEILLYYMNLEEVKKVGTFVVKSVNSNTEPITII